MDGIKKKGENGKQKKMGKDFLPFLPLLALLFLSCRSSRATSPQTKPDRKALSSYILMEKQLADLPHRRRTTAKIIIPSVPANERKPSQIEKTLNQALSDLQKDDPTLTAIIIWAYKNRSELNNTFTLGKLEWSKDKKGFDGKQNLSQETLLEVK